MKKMVMAKAVMFSMMFVMNGGAVYASTPTTPVARTSPQNNTGVWRANSDHAYFSVQIYTPAKIVAGQDQRWHFRVFDNKGVLVNDAVVSVLASIPGQKNSPTFTPNLKPLGRGMFDLHAVNFRKAGRWMVQFEIKSASYQDNASMIVDVKP